MSNYERSRLARIERNQTRLRKLGLLDCNSNMKDPPTKKRPKRAKKKINATASTTRRSQPGRSAKKKARPKESMVVLPVRRSNRIQENRHERNSLIDLITAVEFDINTALIMNDIGEQSIDHDDDSYVDEEDNEEDLDDDLNDDKDDDTEEDEDNHTDVQSKVKFKPDTAMNMEDDVVPRLLELGIVTPAQVGLRGFSVRLAVENDLSARTKKELQQQNLHLCEHYMLARWVLQGDGSRILEIVRCSGIEGHHIDSRSSWAHPKNRMGNHRLNVNGKIICISVVDYFVILM